MFEELSNWFHRHSGKIAIGAVVICAAALIVSTGGGAAPAAIASCLQYMGAASVTAEAVAAGAGTLSSVSAFIAGFSTGAKLEVEKTARDARDATAQVNQAARAEAVQATGAANQAAANLAVQLQQANAAQIELNQLRQQTAQAVQDLHNAQQQANNQLLRAAEQTQALREEVRQLRDENQALQQQAQLRQPLVGNGIFENRGATLRRRIIKDEAEDDKTIRDAASKKL